jgi:hypothetical protein
MDIGTHTVARHTESREAGPYGLRQATSPWFAVMISYQISLCRPPIGGLGTVHRHTGSEAVHYRTKPKTLVGLANFCRVPVDRKLGFSCLALFEPLGYRCLEPAICGVEVAWIWTAAYTPGLCFVFTAKARYRAAATVRTDKLDLIGAVLFRDDAEGDGCHADTETTEASDNHVTCGDPAGFKASRDGENAEVLAAASAHHGDRQYRMTEAMPTPSGSRSPPCRSIFGARGIKNGGTLLAKSADLSQRLWSLVKWTFNPEVGAGCRGRHLLEQTANSEFANSVPPFVIRGWRPS